MKIFYVIVISIAGLLFFFRCADKSNSQETREVTVSKNQLGQYRLFVDGEEFYVLGAGLEFGDIPALAENGANAFRTWRTENGQQDALEILDEAYEHGLMVLMGLEVARERHGFDYKDQEAVDKQFDYLKSEVLRLKDHPALLGWAIGNELNLEATTFQVYNEVNRISKMIHEVDPNHPTTTTLAGIHKDLVDYIKEHCKDLDFLSIQMYGDLVNLQQRIEESGWEGPYMVTEWGATGHWEVNRTSWDAPIEQTSQEKARAFINRFDLAIRADKTNCLGSFVFFWGQKQERTPTWYGMFLENGDKTETVDAMHYIWTGRWPENRCPSLDSVFLNGKTASENIQVKTGEEVHAEVFTTNYENDSLTYHWEILPESTDLKMGGDIESRPETVFSKEADRNITFSLSDLEGPHRLFVYVHDQKGNAATANIPFLIKE